MSDFVQQQNSICDFATSDSWVILSTIELSIKKKIEAVGTPLKDWDINIYRGVLTGCNEAFIIDSEKRDEILANCQTEDERQRTATLIRPILRGRDIKRYGYDWANTYIIATLPSRHYNIEDYPSIKNFLLSFGMERLEQTGKVHVINKEKIKARKKTNNKWFETQDSISYWDDFNKPKIVWAETMRIHKKSVERFPRFSFDEKGFQTDKTCFFAVGEKLEWIVCFLNSYIGQYLCSKYVSILDNGGYLMQKIFIEQIPIPQVNKTIYELCKKQIKQPDANIENELDRAFFNLYGLTDDETAYLISKAKNNFVE